MLTQINDIKLYLNLRQ